MVKQNMSFQNSQALLAKYLMRIEAQLSILQDFDFLEAQHLKPTDSGEFCCGKQSLFARVFFSCSKLAAATNAAAAVSALHICKHSVPSSGSSRW
jgi:hypothetical protein